MIYFNLFFQSDTTFVNNQASSVLLMQVYSDEAFLTFRKKEKIFIFILDDIGGEDIESQKLRTGRTC